eukprot:684978-Pelagomonas_calceolata.AAC.1
MLQGLLGLRSMPCAVAAAAAAVLLLLGDSCRGGGVHGSGWGCLPGMWVRLHCCKWCRGLRGGRGSRCLVGLGGWVHIACKGEASGRQAFASSPVRARGARFLREHVGSAGVQNNHVGIQEARLEEGKAEALAEEQDG